MQCIRFNCPEILDIMTVHIYCGGVTYNVGEFSGGQLPRNEQPKKTAQGHP